MAPSPHDRASVVSGFVQILRGPNPHRGPARPSTTPLSYPALWAADVITRLTAVVSRPRGSLARAAPSATQMPDNVGGGGVDLKR